MIGERVLIGEGCVIGPFAVIMPGVVIGEGNRIHSHAVLGGMPQSLECEEDDRLGLEIGDRNVIREGTTVHKSTKPEKATRIGSDNMLMTNVHVGHDGSIGNYNVLASATILGGHVEIGDHVVTGGGAHVHQFCRIGSHCMIGGGTRVQKDVLPYSLLAASSKTLHYGVNRVGLVRKGFSPEAVKALARAFRKMRREGRGALERLDATNEVLHLKEWTRAVSKRGLSAFARPSGSGGGTD